MQRIILLTLVLMWGLQVQAQVDCPDGLETFKNTVYKKVMRDCQQCHDGSVNNAPPFASQDVKKSYAFLINYADFANPSKSLLYDQAGNGHCGEEECEIDSGDEMLPLIEEWSKVQVKSCNILGKYFTETAELNGLPKGPNKFKQIRLNMDKIRKDLKGIDFVIEVQDYLDADNDQPGAFRIKSPRLVNGSKSLHIRNVKILLDGKYDSISNLYSYINKSVEFRDVKDNSFKTMTPVLDPQVMILIKNGNATPKIGVSFEIVDPKDVANCKDVNQFKQKVHSQLMGMNCASCHNAQVTTNPIVSLLDLEMNKDAEMCRVAKQYINTEFPGISALLSIPTRGITNHPQMSADQSRIYVKALKEWIQSEM